MQALLFDKTKDNTNFTYQRGVQILEIQSDVLQKTVQQQLNLDQILNTLGQTGRKNKQILCCLYNSKDNLLGTFERYCQLYYSGSKPLTKQCKCRPICESTILVNYYLGCNCGLHVCGIISPGCTSVCWNIVICFIFKHCLASFLGSDIMVILIIYKAVVVI